APRGPHGGAASGL
nr:Chain C, Cancer/testis antigen 1 peptide [Homo sapiens]6AVF_P Chain P, ALA-PRO-ARG-GLY-PRO-HIS-GLY-GLY-ALA-ALA-SER-GLY-LEU [Homo sapiens]6AVG_P Chain P, ALA-PRO-ARG-GLY-PRO-HIS-GLY-GLY-ALA-ALA-SER-GLY-LEU [Homo sapiens]6AVG_Q Chain Q, ALA-PRO-ARG-GLY-PRO-HIS-GLY-GLY-ALA-ALA-SER-GLY-LEU [Homo sapiens]